MSAKERVKDEAQTDDKYSNISFEEMYMTNRKTMMYTAMKILNNFADAEDCVSEAFLRIVKIFPEISELGRPKLTSLLVIIVRNAAIDRYRKNQKVTACEAPDEEAGAVHFDSYPSESVYSGIKKLKDEYRDILTLRYVYGYSVTEIVGMLDISADNAYKRIQRAKAELGKILEEEVGHE